ncbi:MAG: CbtA family protein [Cucumibacter sp.]
MFARILFAAVVAGLAAGLVMSAIQQWRVAPLILEAEIYENAAAAHGVNEHLATEPEAWAPADGLERIFYTVLADLLAAIGFALVIAAVSVFAGIEITPANGLLWGLAGFVTFQLAPAFGLAPELPGMPAADLGMRQFWWWGTVLATAAAFLIVAKWRTPATLALAAVLILAPHLIGAPAAPEAESGVPAHLATEFAANALAAAGVFWLLVGPIMGWTLRRFAGTTP